MIAPGIYHWSVVSILMPSKTNVLVEPKPKMHETNAIRAGPLGMIRASPREKENNTAAKNTIGQETAKSITGQMSNGGKTVDFKRVTGTQKADTTAIDHIHILPGDHHLHLHDNTTQVGMAECKNRYNGYHYFVIQEFVSPIQR